MPGLCRLLLLLLNVASRTRAGGHTQLEGRPLRLPVRPSPSSPNILQSASPSPSPLLPPPPVLPPAEAAINPSSHPFHPSHPPPAHASYIHSTAARQGALRAVWHIKANT
ncbi:hypothetical protein L211DRAFT_520092 [Terfezia boudieri ATCC MYA-4762]|uniref:Uncharacterized protein n=1 Tax=Terfezia boudieri ATCC MYA-4762 TaxID=1051890 RepID=A0A3N4LG81_9PEZI|nr:hypothetical protein L211DRAFT_520092 [Terfezia boudieri ATCC MYA-4762]